MAFWKRKTRANPFLHSCEIAEMLRSAGNKGIIFSTFSVVSGYMILLIRTAQQIDTRCGCFFQVHTVAGNTNYRAKDMITLIRAGTVTVHVRYMLREISVSVSLISTNGKLSPRRATLFVVLEMINPGWPTRILSTVLLQACVARGKVLETLL